MVIVINKYAVSIKVARKVYFLQIYHNYFLSADKRLETELDFKRMTKFTSTLEKCFFSYRSFIVNFNGINFLEAN